MRDGSDVKDWPEESREAAGLVIDTYGEPREVTESLLVWNEVGAWKRVLARRVLFDHAFPAPHIDSVESVTNYQAPPDKFGDLARFDGSVMAERTAGEVSARCHDEEASRLALNLTHDIVTGAKDVEAARAYDAKEFADYRDKEPTPYMEKLHFTPGDRSAGDPAERVLSDADLEQAQADGERES